MEQKQTKRGRKRTSDASSLRAQGKDRHKGKRIVYYLPDDMAERLENFLVARKPGTTVAEVHRVSLDDFLKSQGY